MLSFAGVSGAFAGKVAVVTGAASGIGRATAGAFAAAGARVVLLDVDESGLGAAAREVGGVSLVCDVRDPTACEERVAKVVEALGAIDVLVHCAGISHRSLFEETDLGVLRRILDVNFFGVANLTKAALPALIRSRGSIVAISSVAGFAPLLGRTAYAASKHALHGFLDTLRAEVASRGVHVLIVCPSYTRTPIDDRALAGDGRPGAGRGKTVVGRLLEPAEVAGAVLDGVTGRRRLVCPSAVSRASYWLSRLLPSVYERAMRRSQRADFPALA